MKLALPFTFVSLIFALCSSFAQELNDRIYKKDGDSIVCKITTVEENWIYYDHIRKKKLRNDYIHKSDVKWYLQNQVKKKPYEPKPVVVREEKKVIPEGPKDTIQTYYLDLQNVKHSCSILLSRNKTLRPYILFTKLEMLDPTGDAKTWSPNELAGYWYNGSFYRSFTVAAKNQPLHFFAEELENGRALLYQYNGELTDKEPVYIFRKQTEKVFHFIYQRLSVSSVYGESAGVKPQADGSMSNYMPMVFDAEQPYLDYFKNYFSDCMNVTTRFNSSWYSISNLRAVFKDYNTCKQ